jgi:hypothetical protein
VAKEAALDLYRERYEALNGSPLLSVHADEAPRRFGRALDRILPKKGAFFGKNPNERHSYLSTGDDW